LPDRCPDAFVELAGRLADAAGGVVREHFRQPFAIDTKPDATPVTIADRGAERAMREILEAERPDHGIFGEEFGTLRADAEYVWYLDPIDGTRSFISGVPVFGTLIGLTRHRRPVLGVIDQPVSRERWIGAAGMGCFLNGAAASVRACPDLARATVFTTSPDLYTGPDAAAFLRLREQSGLVRYGTDCYAFGLLAAGCIDVAIECGVQDYDYCALVPVIEGAGGVMTNWDGQPLELGRDTRILAAGDPAVHAAAVRALKGIDA
jgi:inositol-phosphate phosphatase/L-galactose 1-phosphate phosphatase/histidinol-phosphatase